MKTLGFGRSKTGKRWLYCFFNWTPMNTIGFARSKTEKRWLFCFFVCENLWKPLVLGGRRVENDDCIVFFLENLWKPWVLIGRRVENDDCFVFLFENIWKPKVLAGRRAPRWSSGHIKTGQQTCVGAGNGAPGPTNLCWCTRNPKWHFWRRENDKLDPRGHSKW